MHRLLLALALLAALVSACGTDVVEVESREPTATVPGGSTSTSAPAAATAMTAGTSSAGSPWTPPACTADPGTDFMPFQVALWWLPTWAEYDAEELVTMTTSTFDGVEAGQIELVALPPNPEHPRGGWVSLGPVEPLTVLKGTPPTDLGMFYDDVILLAEAGAALRPATVLLGFAPADPTGVIPETGVFPVFVLPDGRARFILMCSDYLQQGLDAFAAGQTRFLAGTPADLLRGMVAEDPDVMAAYAEWAQVLGPVAWEDRLPEERLLDPEETPAEDLAALRLVAIAFAAPEAWQGRTEVLCTRATLGWNECVSLTLGEDLEVLAYTVPGEPLSVVVLSESADLRAVVAVIGQIPADVIAAAGDQPIRVEITATTLEEAIAAAARGEAVIRVAP